MVDELREAKKMMEDMVRNSLSPATPSEPIPATSAQEEKEVVQSAEEFFATGPLEKSE